MIVFTNCLYLLLINKSTLQKNINGIDPKHVKIKLKSNINLYTTTLVRESKNNVNLTDTKYVLLPVWVLNLKYKDQIYHFAMNGESGKLVGEIPVSKSKLMLTIVITFILTFIITIIIFKLLGYQW